MYISCKLIISNSDKPDQIYKLHQKGIQNGVDDLVLLEESVIKNYEPDINAKFAIFSPSSGIIDTHSYGESLANDIESNDGLILRKTKFLSADIYNDKIKMSILNPDNSNSNQETQNICHTLNSKISVNCAKDFDLFNLE